MAGKVRTWVWVVVSIVTIGILGVVAFAGIAAYLVARHIDTTQATPAGAAQQFDEVKATFADQKPLIELDSRGDVLRANTNRPVPPNVQAPEQLHLLAFDPSDGRVVRVSLPFWLLRLRNGNTTIDLNGNRMDLEDLRLSIEDLERVGPSLIVDHTAPNGERVLVWSR